MKIENGSLVVVIAGVTVVVPLSAVSADAKVKAWAVPLNYRADGLFVAVTLPGQAEEMPACDMAASQYLGELVLVAGDAEKLAAAKAVKLEEINASCNTAVAHLAADYPEREVQSWPQQVKEAESLAIDPAAPAPLLAAIAEARGLPVVALAERVLSKMTAYAGASGAMIGRRQAAEDRIVLAATQDDLAAIAW